MFYLTYQEQFIYNGLLKRGYPKEGLSTITLLWDVHI